MSAMTLHERLGRADSLPSETSLARRSTNSLLSQSHYFISSALKEKRKTNWKTKSSRTSLESIKVFAWSEESQVSLLSLVALRISAVPPNLSL
jgi:hypothetical protein